MKVRNYMLPFSVERSSYTLLFGNVVIKLSDTNFSLCRFTLDAGLVARIQYPEGPATGHIDTVFSCFPCVYKRMLRWFPSSKSLGSHVALLT
jgi:hypothetical protein